MASQLRPQYHLVDRALGAREAAVDGERPRDVGRVVAVLAAGVDEQQIAVVHAPLVLDVVENARVRPRGHDGRIGVARRALRAEHELDRGLHLVLVHAGLRIAHRLDVSVAADLAGAALARQLGRRAAQPQLVHDRRRILDAHRRREPAPARRAQVGDEPDHPGVEAGVAEPVEEQRALDRVLAQARVELVDRVGRVGPVGGDRALHARPMAGPDLHLPVARPHEEHEALLGVGRVEHRDRVRLVEAGQEVEVGRLPEGVVDVVVAHRLGRGRDDRQAVTDRLDEAPPPLDESRQILAGHVPLIA